MDSQITYTVLKVAMDWFIVAFTIAILLTVLFRAVLWCAGYVAETWYRTREKFRGSLPDEES